MGTARASLSGNFAVEWQVEVDFRGSGAGKWTDLTAQAACAAPTDPTRRIAIVLDDRVVSSPAVGSGVQCDVGIPGGTTVITGNFTQDEAKDLALLIRAGALPVPVVVVEQRTIGPTLGDAAIRASAQAAVIGALLTIAYMIVYYRLLGVLAAVALALYGALSYAVLLLVGATLTLPGIAGFVLAIGMAVDANVLVFERIKEERAGGATTRRAAENGFRRAWSAIADSNATTLLAAGLLFFLASGAVRGFGVTLSIGVVVSVFTALVVTRLFVDLVVRTRLRDRPRLLGLEVGGRFREWIAERRPDLLRHSGRWLAGSAVAVILAVTGIATQGLQYGLDFSGGQLLEYDTQRDRRPRHCPPAGGRHRIPPGGGAGVGRRQRHHPHRPARTGRRRAHPGRGGGGGGTGDGRAGGVRRAHHRRTSCGARRPSPSAWPWWPSSPTWPCGSAGPTVPPRWGPCSTTSSCCWACSPGWARSWTGCSSPPC